jgi:hypothetical protein
VFSFSSIGLHNAAAFSQPIQTINSPGDNPSKKKHMHLREARKTSIPKKRGRLLSPLLPPQRSLACGSSDFTREEATQSSSRRQNEEGEVLKNASVIVYKCTSQTWFS